MTSVFLDLHDSEIDKIRTLGTKVSYGANEQIFQEGDEADCMYFVDLGQVILYIDKFNTKVQIRCAGQGDWFGELAVYNGSRRTAAAMAAEDSALVRVSGQAFHTMLAEEPGIEVKIRDIVNSRNEKLVLEEKMVNMDSFHGRDMHIGIKGDPSMRESAMLRPRFQSIVDRFMPESWRSVSRICCSIVPCTALWWVSTMVKFGYRPCWIPSARNSIPPSGCWTAPMSSVTSPRLITIERRTSYRACGA